MAGNFEAGMKSILSNLNSKINELKAKGENNNGQIDTRGEKNKLAELLAGAEKEIDSTAEKYEKQIENLPHKTYLNVKAKKDEILSNAKAQINEIYQKLNFSLKAYETMKDTNSDGALEVVDKDGVKQKYSDGSYNQLVRSIGEEGYLVEHRTKDGENTGKFRLYKNDKEYYANKDYVASKIGLEPVTKNTINKLFGTKPDETNIYQKYVNEYHRNGEIYEQYIYTYTWDNETSEFIIKDKTYSKPNVSNFGPFSVIRRIGPDKPYRDQYDTGF